MLKIGNKVPKLGGAANGGKTVNLADYARRDSRAGAGRAGAAAGKFVVVYFYPKDNTTGCTREAQDFRDAAAQFARRGAVILGVSRDSVKSHDGFAAKHELPFTLIADSDEAWCKAFDVIQEKTLYGRKYVGVVRSTFLIDPDGKLRREWRNVKVPGHVAAVLAAIDEERK